MMIANSERAPNSVALNDGISKGNVAPLQIEFSFVGRPEHACTSVIEFAFPPRYGSRPSDTTALLTGEIWWQ